jgi:hypothetical protein
MIANILFCAVKTSFFYVKSTTKMFIFFYRHVNFVCGNDEQTYTNPCMADCRNVSISCQGPCPCDTSAGPSGTCLLLNLSHRYLMTRLSLQVVYLWRHVSSTAPLFLLWWSSLEILFGPLHRSSPFIGELRRQAIQIEHGLIQYSRESQNAVYIVRCLWSESTSQDAKPRVQPVVHPPLYITNAGGEPRVKHGVWRPEMWALIIGVCIGSQGSCPVSMWGHTWSSSCDW